MKKLKNIEFLILFENNFFYNLNFIFDILIFLSFFKMYNFNFGLKYPLSITLLNGNIFIIHEKGIDIYNSSLNSKVNNVLNFSEADYINSLEKFGKISISRFSPKDKGYIISIINDYLYIFDYEGTFLYKNETKINDNLKPYYELVPIRNNGNNISYMIGYIGNDNNINLLFCEYDVNNNISKYINSTKFKYKYNGQEKDFYDKIFLTCKLMSKDNQGELIVCFVPLNNPSYITLFFIDPEIYNVDFNNESIYLNTSINEVVKSLRSSINDNKKKCLICFYVNGISGYCAIYSIDDNQFYNINDYNITCKEEYYSINL